MAKIYFKDEQGKKVSVEVTDEVAKQYRESLQEEWRGDAYEGYYSTSLESITEAGHDFADEKIDTEELYLAREERNEKSQLIKKLKQAMKILTKEQVMLVKKIYFQGLSQEEIAEQEGVCKQAISNRMQRIYQRLKKFFEEN